MTVAAEEAETLRRTGAAVLALAASELLGKVATFVMFLVMARVLGVHDFGLLSFGLSLGLLVAVVPSLGLDARVVQLGSAQPALLDRCYGALYLIRVVLSLAVLVLTTGILYATMPVQAATVVALLVASGLLDTWCDASRAACGARQRQQLSAVVLVVQRFAALVLSVGALAVSGSAVHASLGYLLGTAVGAVGMHVAARRAGVRLHVRGSREEARMILEAAPVLGLGSIAAMGVFRIDAALIGILLGTHAVGVYGAGYRIFESILFISWTLSRAYVPVIASRPDDPAHVRLWAQRSLVVVCAIYLPFGVVIALRGDDLVGWLFGSAYVAPGLMLGLAAAPLLFGVMHLCASVLTALRPDPVVLVASIGALAANVGLNVWLLPVWGLTAAAVAACAAFLLQAVVLMKALTRITGSIALPRPLGGVVVASVCAGLVAHAVPAVGMAFFASAAVFVAVWIATSRVLDPVGFAEVRAMLTGKVRTDG
ncbi:oligosaccharide flippase family protein [Nocardioides stalactiti]|uniref:oligosaccharide flippase family protein n=1 Tax=Nocardioides stalactiti TaxID=2755356 RepID=UPI001600D305|nr:oligosaccharide flippase family protein [Nocardioides stalactiti]